jgi:hypothetical protein
LYCAAGVWYSYTLQAIRNVRHSTGCYPDRNHQLTPAGSRRSITQPGLPLKPGRCGTMTHDYKRHGTTTLFAALNVLDGTVIGRCMQRHEECIRFLNAVERDVPAGKLIEAVVDNYATHKHPNSRSRSGSRGIPVGLSISPRPRDRG